MLTRGGLFDPKTTVSLNKQKGVKEQQRISGGGVRDNFSLFFLFDYLYFLNFKNEHLGSLGVYQVDKREACVSGRQ